MHFSQGCCKTGEAQMKQTSPWNACDDFSEHFLFLAKLLQLSQNANHTYHCVLITMNVNIWQPNIPLSDFSHLLPATVLRVHFPNNGDFVEGWFTSSQSPCWCSLHLAFQMSSAPKPWCSAVAVQQHKWESIPCSTTAQRPINWVSLTPDTLIHKIRTDGAELLCFTPPCRTLTLALGLTEHWLTN